MAGATIDEERGEMKVKEAMIYRIFQYRVPTRFLAGMLTAVAAHFRFLVQFLGFAGSSFPFQVTMLGSCAPGCSRSGPSKGDRAFSRSFADCRLLPALLVERDRRSFWLSLVLVCVAARLSSSASTAASS